MIGHTNIVMMKQVLEQYKGFENLNKLVDVGVDLGVTLSIINPSYPTIKCINFDLPHVIKNAPAYPGVEHVGRDMFESVPQGDANFMKDFNSLQNNTMSSQDSAAQKMIVLKSSDNQLFAVKQAVAVQLETIKHIIQGDCADNTIPLSHVHSEILAKVIEYCKRHAEANNATAAADDAIEDGLKTFDVEFLKVDQTTLFDLLLAANYLSIKSLLELTGQAVANIMKSKSSEEIREMLNIKNDFSPEEEAEIRRENAWAYV